ncbi:hypothetical protein H9Q10_05105 [Eikenella sp. S3360]|uniref:Uncharacterized protein n=1 Tax=Eikenella glucosivorans TaxID=2766967 RepID=A0ABS0N9U9_9NEIS|nr:hypothetical protein [Eikenella glucosivorans]MBH5329045.1 hypothetical protein [Eikenella glucosivorans]
MMNPIPLTAAFPSALRDSAAEVVRRLQIEPSGAPCRTVCLHGETLQLPYRLYHPAPQPHATQADHTAQLIADCLHSRHHNGFVRQAAFRRLVRAGQADFVLPFALTLLGEYILPIQEDAVRLFRLNPAAFARLCAANPRYWQTQQRRIISYWNAYHRPDFPNLARYPIYQAAQEINAAVRQLGSSV